MLNFLARQCWIAKKLRAAIYPAIRQAALYRSSASCGKRQHLARFPLGVPNLAGYVLDLFVLGNSCKARVEVHG